MKKKKISVIVITHAITSDLSLSVSLSVFVFIFVHIICQSFFVCFVRFSKTGLLDSTSWRFTVARDSRSPRIEHRKVIGLHTVGTTTRCLSCTPFERVFAVIRSFVHNFLTGSHNTLRTFGTQHYPLLGDN